MRAMRKAAERVGGLRERLHRTRVGGSFCSERRPLTGGGCVLANKARCKKHDNPQPGRQRRRAQQVQRVDGSLLK